MKNNNQLFQWDKVAPQSKHRAVVIIVFSLICSFMVGMRLNLNNQLFSLSDWNSFTISEMQISIPYPSSWKTSKITTWVQKVDNSVSYGQKITDPKGEISLVWGNGDYGGGCDEEFQEEHLILGTKTTVCHYLDNNKYEIISFYLPKNNEWWASVTVSLEENENNTHFFRNFISRIVYTNK